METTRRVKRRASEQAQEEERKHLHESLEGQLQGIIKMEQDSEYLVALQHQERVIKLYARRHAILTQQAATCKIRLTEAQVVRENLIKEFQNK